MAQTAVSIPTPVRVEGPAAAFWRRFRRNWVAVVALVFLAAVHALGATAPLVAPYSPEEVDLTRRLTAPGPAHWLGTDENGRDVLSRLIYGAQVSLTVGLLSAVVAVALGTMVGAVSGYFGGLTDALLMRFTDGMMILPTFFLALLVLAVFGPGIVNVIAVIGLTSWMGVSRIVRGEVLRTRPQEFVLAARALGARNVRVLPQAVPAIIVATTLGIAQAILTESALSYLGLGIQPPTPTWGNMLASAQHFLWVRPDLAVYPGALILLTVLAYNSVGDALRDALDPFMK
ncbi:MAG: ABC transporter permease [Chloroflexota bacterium]